MKITIDSNEPLADAIRVLGAMYDVTLDVAAEQPRQAQPATIARTAASRRSRAGSTGKPTAVAAVTTTSKEKTPAKPGPVSTNAEIRSWARSKGLTVSDRGRVAASVMSAYHDAHRG